MEQNKNIPAFPSHGSMGEVVQEGMSLRDYFAGLAMQAILSRHGFTEKFDITKEAYNMAGNMLIARNKHS